MEEKNRRENRIAEGIIAMGAMTLLLIVIFLDKAFRQKCLVQAHVFHIAGELASIIIILLLTVSFAKATGQSRLDVIAGISHAFRLCRSVCLGVVALMIADIVIWLYVIPPENSVSIWLQVWYVVAISVFALAYAGAFQWMTDTSWKLDRSFRRLMSENVASELIKTSGESGKTGYVTTLFCQVNYSENGRTGSGTAGSGQEEQAALIRLLRMFYSETAEICEYHGGTALEFPGSCVLCVFGAPGPLPAHERSAVQAAMEIAEEMKLLDSMSEQTGFPPFTVSIGINTGNAHVGNVGNEKMKRFTVIGSSVNLASRAGSFAKPGEILITENVKKAVCGSIPLEKAGKVMPKGFDEAISIYRVLPSGGAR